MPSHFLRFVCLLALVACAPLAHAQQHVYRCIGTHGEPVFSGQPCGTPAPQPGQTAGTQAIATGGACAASPQALRQDIARAVAKHDANRMAGLILWRGMDQASAQATLRGLSTWLQQPLAGIAIDYAHDPPSASAAPYPPAPVRQPATASSAPVQPPIGFEVSTGGGDGSTRSFGVTEFGGCWWLTF